MGSEDHLFLPPVREIVQKNAATLLTIIENCGHVVNIEQPDLFNQHSIAFIRANG
jgi:pimeloyl-ACP methyl ester carboxylesterase